MRDHEGVERKLRTFVFLPIVWTNQSGEHSASVSNLSLSGCFLDTRGTAELGEIITLKLRLPMEQEMQLRATVIRLQDQPRGIGVQFLELSADERKVFALLVANSYERRKLL